MSGIVTCNILDKCDDKGRHLFPILNDFSKKLQRVGEGGTDHNRNARENKLEALKQALWGKPFWQGFGPPKIKEILP